jgi:hypothetical protein
MRQGAEVSQVDSLNGQRVNARLAGPVLHLELAIVSRAETENETLSAHRPSPGELLRSPAQVSDDVHADARISLLEPVMQGSEI